MSLIRFCLRECLQPTLKFKWFSYEFGYGLSYTTFSVSSNITVSKTNSTAFQNTYSSGLRSIGGRADLWDIVATVSTSVTNTGNLAGSEVAQLYVSFPEAAGKPLRELRGFEKVKLAPGETKEVEFQLRRRDLSVWDVEAQEWAVLKGSYGMHVGASSRDLKGSGSLTV